MPNAGNGGLFGPVVQKKEKAGESISRRLTQEPVPEKSEQKRHTVLADFSRRYKYHLDHGDISARHMSPCPSLCPSNPFTMSSRSRSSSLTVTNTSSSAPTTSPAHSSTTTILQDEQLKFEEAGHDEARFEAFGGEDPIPTIKSSARPPPHHPSTDPNLVTWDGPDDPENPQNWSFWYKWWLTIVCTVMALNVYVPSTTKLAGATWGN